MGKQSWFSAIKRQIQRWHEESGRPTDPSAITRAAIEEVLAGHLLLPRRGGDPLAAALAYWADQPESAVAYTARGFMVNAATVREAVREAKKMMATGKTLAPTIPLMLPASAGVIHGEVAREFWGLLNGNYRMDWRGLLIQAWSEVSGRATPQQIRAMSRARRQAIQAKALTRAWILLRHRLKRDHGKTINDVKREAWARVLGVSPETPVRPVKPAPKPPVVKQSTKAARRTRGRVETVKRKGRIAVRATEEATGRAGMIETPYGPTPAMLDVAPSEVKPFRQTIDAVVKLDDKQGGKWDYDAMRYGLSYGFILANLAGRNFRFPRALVKVLEEQKQGFRIGMVQVGEAITTTEAKGSSAVSVDVIPKGRTALVLATRTGHYLFGEVEELSAGEKERWSTAGLPLEAVLAAVRGRAKELDDWVAVAIGVERGAKGAKGTTMRSFALIAPELAEKPIGDIETLERRLSRLRQRSHWGNFALMGSSIVVFCKVRPFAEGIFVGFRTRLFGPLVTRHDTRTKAVARNDARSMIVDLAEFLATRAQPLGEAYAEAVSEFTSIEQLEAWLKTDKPSRMPGFGQVAAVVRIPAAKDVLYGRSVPIAEFRKQLEYAWEVAEKEAAPKAMTASGEQKPNKRGPPSGERRRRWTVTELREYARSFPGTTIQLDSYDGQKALIASLDADGWNVYVRSRKGGFRLFHETGLSYRAAVWEFNKHGFPAPIREAPSRMPGLGQVAAVARRGRYAPIAEFRKRRDDAWKGAWKEVARKKGERWGASRAADPFNLEIGDRFRGSVVVRKMRSNIGTKEFPNLVTFYLLADEDGRWRIGRALAGAYYGRVFSEREAREEWARMGRKGTRVGSRSGIAKGQPSHGEPEGSRRQERKAPGMAYTAVRDYSSLRREKPIVWTCPECGHWQRVSADASWGCNSCGFYVDVDESSRAKRIRGTAGR